MHSINLANGGRASDAWMRITVKARLCMRDPNMLRIEYQGPRPKHEQGTRDGLSLWDAVQEMHAEQRADGMRRGASLCDYGDCGRPGTHVWERTPKELKSMRCGGKKGIAPLPSVCHCEEHIPSWRVSSYRPVSVRVSREAAA